jgi:hypothetical protein
MQDTQTFTTPLGGKTVVIKSWMTGRDKVAIQSAVNEQFKVNFGMDGGAAGASSTLAAMAAGNDVALERLVVSVDGVTANVKDLVLDMHSQDYDFVIEQVNKVTAATPEAQAALEEKKSDGPDRPLSAAEEAQSSESQS